MKPIIKPVSGGVNMRWRCGFIGYGWCYGATPTEAYDRWHRIWKDTFGGKK